MARPLLLVSLLLLFAFVLLFRLPGQELIGRAYVAGSVPPGFAPPWNPFSGDSFLSASFDGSSLVVTASQEGMLFYKTFFVYDKSAAAKWRAYRFDEASRSDYWIADTATASISLDSGTLDPESWVLVYGCANVGGVWRCGCSSSTDTVCGLWSIQNFTGSNKSTGCVDDRSNASVCGSAVCGSANDACGLARSCGTCAAGVSCVAGDCVAPLENVSYTLDATLIDHSSEGGDLSCFDRPHTSTILYWGGEAYLVEDVGNDVQLYHLTPSGALFTGKANLGLGYNCGGAS